MLYADDHLLGSTARDRISFVRMIGAAKELAIARRKQNWFLRAPEGNELVIETARFRAHPEGIDRGIPAGTEKKVEERISLNEAGVVRVVATVTDPEHLTEPVVRTYDMRRINAALVDYDCELGVARRYRQGRQ